MNFLFLCTHNSARSVLAECMFNHLAGERGLAMRAFSAGSSPSGSVKPLALEVLHSAGVDTGGVHSKGWDQFATTAAPSIHAVITVCDNAAAEQCPIWPGAPVLAHWGYPDPSNAGGTLDERRVAFELTRQALAYRILRLLASLDRATDDERLQKALARAR